MQLLILRTLSTDVNSENEQINAKRYGNFLGLAQYYILLLGLREKNVNIEKVRAAERYI